MFIRKSVSSWQCNQRCLGEQSFHYRADDGTDAFKYLIFRFEDDSAGKPVCQNRVHPITSSMSIVTVLLLAVLDNAKDSCDVTGSKDSDSEGVLIRIQKGRHLYTFIQGKYAKYIALLMVF